MLLMVVTGFLLGHQFSLPESNNIQPFWCFRVGGEGGQAWGRKACFLVFFLSSTGVGVNRRCGSLKPEH